MKALVKKHTKEGIWLEDVPMPEVGNNDVLVKIKKTAICGTDIHIYKWDEWAQKTIPVPMTTGHEFAGEIVELGSNVTDLKVGDIVSGEGHITCGRCRNCLAGRKHLCPNTIGIGVNRTGCFAEYLSIPAENVFKPSREISTDLLACFDPYGNAVHTALSFNMVGEDVLITGAGPIGIMAAMVAMHAGARNIVITDLNQYRLDLAKKAAPKVVPINVAKETISREFMQDLGIFEGFDVGLEMSGSPHAFSNMLNLMISGGNIAMLAIMPSGSGIDWDQVVFKGLTIKGIYGREIFETWYKGSMMVQSGLPLEDIITHHFHYTDFQKGFDAMLSGESGKVILNWED
ncbi:MAG TPA: L-threonine 3-dehydrogenase [Gammaproteobacteria bacterium]|jgi:threonine 3-dehydrogenase|nr:L-threonine 3-dehydrogenase [Gammaproteobacteria bacterium]HAE04706.1 L-threonine 3-dehydrogenase [Gammaproteobacteria bacterium]HAE72657.1 L-threonine 3-dehydrogenase [Gammaproteobacteria bacterium]HAG47926.1 L-threonine 3-dehydrogenase [Gammaproteobacteria bacterium]HAN33825.1 L-threonine 3-dehydrogenase [Gammaproteobacteria bacterium]